MATTARTTPEAPESPTEDSLAPIRDEDFGYEQARHLLLRAGFGGTDHQIRTLASWGPEKAVNHLLDYTTIPALADSADAFDSSIIRPLSQDERRAYALARQRGDEDTLARFRTMRQRAQREDRRQMREIQRWWLTRMIRSPRPLEEKLTLFWHGHFATSYRITEDSYHMYAQNRMLRASAAGNVAGLLRGIITDPAMLRYLNNNQNRKGAPNENLARELLELFTMGEGNYAEHDIKEAARALTGYTYEDDGFVFNRNQHDGGSKAILGIRGTLDGDGLVNAILRQRACSEFLGAKLYRFFVRDIPLEARGNDTATRKAVLDLASTMRRAKYELRPVLKRLFMSRHFYDPANVGTKIKSPAELLVGAVRSLNVPVRDMGIVTDAMDLMGQSVFYPPSVKGWDGGRAWINTATMFVRQNTLVYLLTGELPSRTNILKEAHHVNAMALVPCLSDPDVTDPSDERIVRELAMFTLGFSNTELVGSVIRASAADESMRSERAVTRALVMLTSMPEYQLC